MKIVHTMVIAAAALAGAVPAFGVAVPPANYADYGVLQFPGAITVQVGQTTPAIFGRIYEPSMTEATGLSPFVVAELGVGPIGSNPMTDAGWTWSPTTFNVQVGNDDEYSGTVTPTEAGTYAYTYRFAVDGGLRYIVADLDGNGTAAGLSFSPTMLGTLNVTPVPEPTAGALVAGSLGALWVRRRRQTQRA